MNRSMLMGVCLGVCATTHAAVRIMPLGDSITRGLSSGQGGYRPILQAALESNGYNASAGGAEFVGPYPGVVLSGDSNAGTGWSTTPPPGTDLDHYGYAGRSFADYARSTENGEGDRATFVQRLTDHPADIVLLHMGTNDVNWRDQGAAFLPTNTINTLRGYVDSVLNDLYTNLPGVHVVLAKIIGDARVAPATDLTRNDRILQFNEEVIGDVYADRAALGQRISLVDMYAALPRNGIYYADGVHPTAVGYQLMADEWMAAIQSVPDPGGVTVWVGAVACAGRRRR